MDTISLIGKRFGKLVVVEYSNTDKHGHTIWICLCQCGRKVLVARSSLTRGLSTSCGCSPKKKRTVVRTTSEGVQKRCFSCMKWLSVSNFFKSKNSWDGLQKRCKNCFRIYKNNNIEKSRETHRNYSRNRRASDPEYRLLVNLRDRISKAIRGNLKSQKTSFLVGCSIEELKSHLERMFSKSMSWENYGSYWHVDHIKPCASFDFSDPKQQRACFHYTNLQPLEKTENLLKNSWWDGKFIRGVSKQ